MSLDRPELSPLLGFARQSIRDRLRKRLPAEQQQATEEPKPDELSDEDRQLLEAELSKQTA